MPVDLRQLRYTIAAADYRSLRRADAVRLKESTLNRCVRDLEAELNVVLFERSRAGVRPTVAGAASRIRFVRHQATACFRGASAAIVVSGNVSLSH